MTDQVWDGCVVPSDLLYDVERHVWVRMEDGVATLGMTDVAQTMGGKLVTITWKDPGRKVRKGKSLAVIESAKWVGPFPTPLTCEVVENNAPGFADDILIANRDPYGEGWLYRVRPTNPDEELAALMDGREAFQAYKGFIEKEGIRCYRCAD